MSNSKVKAISNKRHITSFAIAGLVAITAAAWGISRHEARADAKPQAAAPQATPVEVAAVIKKDIIDWHQFSGRLETVDRVEVHPQVSGILTAVHFKDGTLVKKGDVLFSIDSRPYAAEVARVQAQLTAAQARAAYAASDVARGERLMADNAIAKREFEEKQNADREAHANVEAAQAALRVAKLNLEYTQITAPISGRMSRAEVTVGNLVGPNNPAALTTLVSAEKIYASFDVDEQTFLKYVNPAYTNKNSNLPVQLGLANEADYPHRGQLHSVDNRLDTSSGTIRVRAIFDNPNRQMVPGLYARVRLGGGEARPAVLITEKAIGTDQDKRFVLVVNPQNKTAYREVKVGSNHESYIVVEDGLRPGERIVVNGLQRVKPGDAVAPQLVSMDGSPLNPRAMTKLAKVTN